MKKGQMVPCEDWCGEYFPAHRGQYGEWVRFISGHNLRTVEARKRAGITLAEYNRSDKGRERSVRNGRVTGKTNIRFTRNTKHEQLLKQKLDRWGIKYKHNTKTFRAREGRGGDYRIDFYLAKFGIALEVDGRDHDSERRIKKDARRDRFLMKHYGVCTIRVKNKNVAKLTKNKLLRLIEVR